MHCLASLLRKTFHLAVIPVLVALTTGHVSTAFGGQPAGPLFYGPPPGSHSSRLSTGHRAIGSDQASSLAPVAGFEQVALVSSMPGEAAFPDGNLIRPRGIVPTADGMLRVAGGGTGLITLYDANGTPESSVVTIPVPMGATQPATPTGLVYNASPDFEIDDHGQTAPAQYLAATENGTIVAWSAALNSPNASIVVDNSKEGAVYKGLALAHTSSGSFLYATNFRQGRVEMYGSSFDFVKSFTDSRIPTGFAPFGIQNVGEYLFVTFARQQGPGSGDEAVGPGTGFVDVFDTSGKLLRRFASQGSLNAPWGIALAPAHFGRFSHKLLIGNYGDGRINAYEPATGHFLGQLEDQSGAPLEIEGLWGMAFLSEHRATLYFAGGTDDGEDGLIGSIMPVL